MSGQVAADGRVIAPLNITAPAPSLNLKGFHWQTVDEKILGPQQGYAAAAPGPESGTAALVAPLPGQLASQLVHGSFRSTRPQPPFPLAHFQGSYAGNGFNLIWRPRAKDDDTKFPIQVDPAQPDDNILQLNLTTEQLTFGETIGAIPNRGLKFDTQAQQTIFLEGFPYLQTVQDVTNPDSGLGDNLIPTDIHFEPGMFLAVPECRDNPKNGASVVRMASIPHGTTINAQGLSPAYNSHSSCGYGGTSGPPDFDARENMVDSTPHIFNDFNGRLKPNPFEKSMTVNAEPMDEKNTTDAPARIPQDLSMFNKAGTITTEIIRNPNLVLKKAIKGLKIIETTTFSLATGPSKTPGGAVLNGGGTANISFLTGTQDPITSASPGKHDVPNAHADFMTAKYWIEVVEYQVKVPKVNTGGTLLLRPTMPQGSTAPTPVFAVTTPSAGIRTEEIITIPGIQIQCSQVVNLNFATLTWPHISVSTLVPVDPQPYVMK